MEQHHSFQTLAEIEAHYERQLRDLHEHARGIIHHLRLLSEFVGMPFDESLQDDLNKLMRTNTPA